MFGSAILEVGISLAFVFMLLSLIASAIQEAVEGWLKVRASNLEKGIQELLQDGKLAEAIYRHPLIVGLYQGPYRTGRSNLSSVLPTYIPAGHFASALLDLVVRGPVQESGASVSANAAAAPTATLTLAEVRTQLEANTLLTPTIRRILLLALDHAGDDLDKAKAYLEGWFNDGMQRVSGWYKRHTQGVLLVIGVIIAVGMNVNALKIANELYHNENLRATVVAQAEVAQKDGAPQPGADPKATLKATTDTLAQAKLPIGWHDDTLDKLLHAPCKVLSETPLRTILQCLLGWLSTAFAISFGAAFWFDTLSRLITVRSTVKPIEQAVAKLAAKPAGGQKGAAGNS